MLHLLTCSFVARGSQKEILLDILLPLLKKTLFISVAFFQQRTHRYHVELFMISRKSRSKPRTREAQEDENTGF